MRHVIIVLLLSFGLFVGCTSAPSASVSDSGVAVTTSDVSVVISTTNGTRTVFLVTVDSTVVPQEVIGQLIARAGVLFGEKSLPFSYDEARGGFVIETENQLLVEALKLITGVTKIERIVVGR